MKMTDINITLSFPPSQVIKYKTIDVMLDLETVGLCDNAVITQLSAVAFSIDNGSILDTFDEHIGIKPSVQKGLKIDGSSMEWWFKQPNKVYEEVFVKAMTSETKIEDVLSRFDTWLKSLKDRFGVDYKSNINMWGNGALADNKWIRQAYKVCNMEPPWAFYEDRDVRTIVELGRRLFDYEYRKTLFEGTVHNAVDDCKHQIKYCSEIYGKLKNQKA
jgi:hypothetical protein